MKQTRLLALLVLLVGILILRWFDPLGLRGPASVPEIAAAVEKPAVAPGGAAAASAGQSVAVQPAWPVRPESKGITFANAFMTRTEVAQMEAQRQQARVAKQMAKTPVFVPPPPPPPPPPPEPSPPLQVIGTWGSTPDLAVFLSTPNGTQLVHLGDTLLATYKVQAINAQQVTLVQTGNQKVWTLDIPSAPSQLQTWPGR